MMPWKYVLLAGLLVKKVIGNCGPYLIWFNTVQYDFNIGNSVALSKL